MDREPRNRGGASSSSAQKRPRRKSVGSRVGLRRRQPAKPAARRPAHPSGAAANPHPRPYAPQNPQKPGYRPAAGAGHRVTRAQQQRQRRNRAILGFVLVAAVFGLGLLLSFNLLFKVTGYRIVNADNTTPANTGIYTEEQIIELLDVPVGENLFGFSSKEKSRQLAAQLPYLEEVTVRASLPGTVVIRVRPAVERFAVNLPAGWLVLSEERKVLRTSEEPPEGLITLEAPLPPDVPTLTGQYLTLGEFDPAARPATAETATAETAAGEPVPEATPEQLLQQLVDALQRYGLFEGTTGINITDPGEITFAYQGRLTVRLGTINSLEDKFKLAATTILDVEGQGLGANDRGTLDVSYQRSDNAHWAYFQPYEPAPEPTAPPEETEGEDGGTTGDGETGEGGNGETAGTDDTGDTAE